MKKAFDVLKKLKNKWAKLDLKELNLQDIIYYSVQKRISLKSLDEMDPELIKHLISPHFN